MPTNDALEGLMVRIMNHFAEVFGPQAILKGGMVLRLLDCPRYTNDLDYVFIPHSSKREIVPKVIKALQALPGVTVTHSLNSKCLRCQVVAGEVRVQVEVQVAQQCSTTELSTIRLAHAHGQQGHIIRVMSFESALAHKLAAWNERRLMRDLYDAYFMFTVMAVHPDYEVLVRRLESVERRVSGGSNQKHLMSLSELVVELEQAAGDLTNEKLEAELRDILTPEECVGLAMKLRISLFSLCENLRKTS
jgi:predicted nucleotidyltransferase component of viral defense system